MQYRGGFSTCLLNNLLRCFHFENQNIPEYLKIFFIFLNNFIFFENFLKLQHFLRKIICAEPANVLQQFLKDPFLYRIWPVCCVKGVGKRSKVPITLTLFLLRHFGEVLNKQLIPHLTITFISLLQIIRENMVSYAYSASDREV